MLGTCSGTCAALDPAHLQSGYHRLRVRVVAVHPTVTEGSTFTSLVCKETRQRTHPELVKRMEETQSVRASSNFAAADRIGAAARMLNIPSLWHRLVPFGCMEPLSACTCMDGSTSTDGAANTLLSCPEGQLIILLLAAVRCVR